MSRTLKSLLCGGLAGTLVAVATMFACTPPQRPPQPPVPPLGESTAPSSPNAPAPVVDGGGGSDPSAPTGAWAESRPPIQVAQAESYALDAGIPHPPGIDAGLGSAAPEPTNPPNAPRPTNPTNGAGSGGNPVPAEPSPSTPEPQPSPTQPPTPPSVPPPSLPPAAPYPGQPPPSPVTPHSTTLPDLR